jgi:hypothetical protein
MSFIIVINLLAAKVRQGHKYFPLCGIAPVHPTLVSCLLCRPSKNIKLKRPRLASRLFVFQY